MLSALNSVIIKIPNYKRSILK